MQVLDLTVLVLTHNEERHVKRCLASVAGIAKRVVVVDSGSTDRTRDIAASMGAAVLQNPWINYAKQFNWGLENARIQTAWVMRLDADEVVTPELAATLVRELGVATEIAGFTVQRQIHFLGRWIKHGGIYPRKMLRVWRNGLGSCEDRWMDEHMVVKGEIRHLDADIADINLNNLTWWVEKHNTYASREAVDILLSRRSHHVRDEGGAMGWQAKLVRWLKWKVYLRLPPGFRCVAYFVFRYFCQFGFLDGWQGQVFHCLQGLWYRYLVDVKVRELQEIMRRDGLTLEETIWREFGYRV
jgi:glycosyltransferase involved in cell wall biosynthesis